MAPSFGEKSEAKRYAHFRGVPTPTPLFEILAEGLTLDAVKAQWLVEFGAVYVNFARVIEPGHLIKSDDLVRVHLEPRRYSLDKAEIQKRVVNETEDYLIVDKPSGLPMHPTLDNLHENLLAAFDFPTYVTHRLDVPTSGLVVVAKTKEYQTLFNKLISSRGVKKIYRALIDQPAPVGLHRHFMEVSQRAPKKLALEYPDGEEKLWDECLLKILSCEKRTFHEIIIELLTGRTHQIRAQLAFMGAPIIGDEMYGGRPADFFGLCASELEFVCPKTKSLIRVSQK